MPPNFPIKINFSAIFLIYMWLYIKNITGSMHDPRNQFYHHETVRPVIYTATERKDKLMTQGTYEDEVTVDFKAFNKSFIINLYMNKNLLAKNYFEQYQSNNGGNITFRPMEQKKGKHCHYHGQIYGLNSSWAAISLCNGISGVIYDGEEMHYIEPDSKSDDSSHFVFKGSDWIPRHKKCGVEDQQEHIGLYQYPIKQLQVTRSTNPKIPYTSNETPLIVENLYYVSNSEYQKHGEGVTNRLQQIANLVNAVYAPLNIVIALIGIIIWDRQDEINVVSDSNKVLSDFLEYRQKHLKDHPNDNAILFTSGAFDGGVVGKALLSLICQDSYSGEIIGDDNDVLFEPAMTTAHELGHNFGMPHDDPDKCNCANEKKKCIMNPSVVTPPPTQWTDCSLRFLKEGLAKGSDYCMKNKPKYAIGPICGNGLVEEGEQCDCGPTQFCKNRCCNAATCRLASNAVCATGRCCDLQTCQMKRAGTECRARVSTCDLPEFCDGSSEFCPENVYRQNGFECGRKREGICYEGQCNSHENQCKLVWGSSGQVADTRCYDKNTDGSRNFNCGAIDIEAEKFLKCESQDTLCGRLQCVDNQNETQFGIGIQSRPYVGHVLINRKWYPCRTAVVNLGPDRPDPGLTPDGAKCGNEKACLNQKCVPLSQLKSPNCPADCNNNGVCNSKGNCHCNRGYAPPDCRNPGKGGSTDSGPAS